ncbi:heme-dependent peroxidase [Alloacidobacterium dinghuense]|uniref:Heme-dependent peroxidase n=1 Tax=Alloacidobacterium dinghuense TaxID=2763107 RepID=A0A7G8BMA1_9BACT|nr:hydrogen peroxide-dependent heme synthase [Alloacidobacterium dinghuense]QNI33671.1 heme-dependent peroxidase [Alloacidobacterium dinghuense]
MASTVNAQLPAVPLTIEGACILHLMYKFRWTEWGTQSSADRQSALGEAADFLQEAVGGSSQSNQAALYSVIGQKADLMLIYFADSMEDLNRFEIRFAQTALYRFLDPAGSYISIVELGLYESSAKTYADLIEKQIEPHSPEWNEEIKAVLERQKNAMTTRLFPSIPQTKYLCFYPMDRRRGESKNWYTEEMGERQRMMHEHGLIGRRYAAHVKQIISGSIGFDDWEWAVDLFADDALVFKKLIYEMRFDEVSAVFAQFGTFHLGVRLQLDALGQWADGSRE